MNGDAKILKVIDLYTRPDNPLFVPEARPLTPDKVKYLVYPVLAHGGIGFACFGIDKNENDSLFSAEYALLTPLISRLAEWDAEGKTSALVEPEDHSSQSINRSTTGAQQ